MTCLIKHCLTLELRSSKRCREESHEWYWEWQHLSISLYSKSVLSTTHCLLLPDSMTTCILTSTLIFMFCLIVQCKFKMVKAYQDDQKNSLWMKVMNKQQPDWVKCIWKFKLKNINMTIRIVIIKHKETEGRHLIKSQPDCLFGALYVDGHRQKHFIKMLPSFSRGRGCTHPCVPSASGGFGQTFQGLQMRRMRRHLDARTQEDLCSNM